MPKRDIAQMQFRQRDETPGARIARQKSGLRFKRANLRLQRQKRIELKLLFRVPLVRHMRHQRAEMAKARTTPKLAFIDEQDIEPGAPRLQRGPEPHDATADDHKIDAPAPLTGKVRRFIAFGHGQGNSRKTRGRKAPAA